MRDSGSRLEEAVLSVWLYKSSLLSSNSLSLSSLSNKKSEKVREKCQVFAVCTFAVDSSDQNFSRTFFLLWQQERATDNSCSTTWLKLANAREEYIYFFFFLWVTKVTREIPEAKGSRRTMHASLRLQQKHCSKIKLSSRRCRRKRFLKALFQQKHDVVVKKNISRRS